MVFKAKKLNQYGILAHTLPVIVVVLVAIIGVGYLVYARAQAAATPQIESAIVTVNLGSWCVTSIGSTTAANVPVYSKVCNGATTQQWSYNATNETLTNSQLTNSNRCLAIGSNRTTVGAYIVMNSCNGSKAQKWQHTNSNQSFASALNTKDCLAIYGGYTGRQLRTNTCVSTYNTQKWLLNMLRVTVPPPPSNTTGEAIIATLYAYPTLSTWTQVETSAPTVKYAIVNICAPDGSGSGCGRPADEINNDWKPTIQALKNAGITPLYYISTNYGGVPLATVESELANAKTWYGITDPMFDTTATNNPNYYQSLYAYATSTAIGANRVVYNPGTIVPESYMFGGTGTTSKVIMQIYEGTATGFGTSSFPSWVKNYPANDFSATLSTGNATTVGTDVQDAVKDNIGNFYEDDENEPPNYATLPSFWMTEVHDVANSN